MNVKDFFAQGTGSIVRLREKGGRRKQIACHHLLEEYLAAYIAAAGLMDEPDSPLFRTVKGKTKQLTENRIDQSAAWRMLQRRARQAGVEARLCNHTWRASGITTFLENGGALGNGPVHGRPRRPSAPQNSTTAAGRWSPAPRSKGSV